MNKRKYLKEGVIKDLIKFLSLDLHIAYDIAMSMVYKSDTLSMVMDDETGLYLESSPYVYDILSTELNLGRIVQTEI